MRVITGSARGMALKAPKGMDTRPTMDQVKEGIFSAIQFEVEGARVLDLFAGSGALAPGDPLPNVCIHGHTHIPEIVVGKEARPADLLLCPGSPTNPRGGFPQCVAKIDVWEGRILRAWVERTTRGPHCGEVVLRHDFA